MKVSMTMKLKDHITQKVVTTSPDQSLKDAYKTMRNHWIRHLPVINEDGYVVGILSDRDIQRSLISNIQKEGEVINEVLRFPQDAIVSDYMTSPVRFFDVDTPLIDVVDSMITEKCSSYLISHKDEVIGIITTDDMLKLLAALLSEGEDSKQNLKWFWTHPSFQRATQMISDMGI